MEGIKKQREAIIDKAISIGILFLALRVTQISARVQFLIMKQKVEAKGVAYYLSSFT